MFVSVLEKLKIKVPQVKPEFFEEGQSTVRELICRNFAAETDTIWDQY